MSLIIEALKRARDDAVRRQDAAQGLPLAPVPLLKGRSRWFTFAVVPLAAALVICILLLIDLYSRLPPTQADHAGILDTQSSGDVPTEIAPIPPAPREEGLGTAGTEIGSSTTVISESSPADDPAPNPQVPGAEEPPMSTPLPSGSPDKPGELATTARIRVEPVSEAAGSRIFIGQAELGDGQIVDLGGIAWSESEPYALLNGQVIGVGELIRSYRVIEISPVEVVLEQNDDRVVLRLK